MVDEGRCDEATSNPWSLRSIASWRDAEGRLEVLTAPACFGRCWILQDKGRRKYVHVRQIKGSPGVSRRDGGITSFCRNRCFTVADRCSSGEKFHQPGGAIDSGARGETERREGAIYRRREGSKQAGINAY
jgi:hypothetical protein